MTGEQIHNDAGTTLRIAQLHVSGHMVSEIARRVGCTTAQVARVAQALATPPPGTRVAPVPQPWPAHWRRIPVTGWTPELLEDLFRLSAQAVCAKYRVFHGDVKAMRKRLGIPRKPCCKSRRSKFTDHMIALLGKRTDRRLARAFLLSVGVVRAQRRALGIPSYRASSVPWTPEYLALLGTMPDQRIATRMGVNVTSVAKKRNKLGIKPCVLPFRWTLERIGMFHVMSDAAVAEKVGLSASQVTKRRQQFGIPSFENRKSKWTAERTALLGTATDEELADRLGVTVCAVKSKRNLLGIPCFGGGHNAARSTQP